VARRQLERQEVMLKIDDHHSGVYPRPAR
jgi:hypothetical protein